MILLAFIGCADEPTVDSGAYAIPVVVEPLDAPRLLRRISLDLRGVLPTEDELDAVAGDPALVSSYRDEWFADPRFEERLVDLLAETWHTRSDEFDIKYYDYHLTMSDDFAFNQAVGEEPLRLAAHVAATDAPWTTIVTADWSMGNELLASIWPEDYPAGGSGWQPVTYTDDRPAAGILATNGLWWRYSTNTFNLSRSRAAATVRLLLCQDFLVRPVSFAASPALLDPDATASAVTELDACLSCHAAIEPIASTMFSFFPREPYSVVEQDHYHGEGELTGVDYLGVEGAWFGVPVEGLGDLAGHLAADPRFDRCAAETAATALWRRPVALEDWARVDALREEFIGSDRRMIPLMKAVMESPEYQAGSLSADADADDAERERTRRLLSAPVLESVIEDLTGFTWYTNSGDYFENDKFGYRVMVGGVNGENVLRPQQDPGLTWALVVKRVAEAGAQLAATAHFAGEEGTLLDGVSEQDAPGSEAFDAKIDSLTWRLLAVTPDETRRTGLSDLWSSVAATSGVEQAWAAVLTALFRDPEFVTD